HPLPPDRRHRVPGPRRGQGRAGVAAAGGQPGRRRGLPARGHQSQAGGRRDHARAAGGAGAQRQHADGAGDRIGRRAQAAAAAGRKRLPRGAAISLDALAGIVRGLRAEAQRRPPSSLVRELAHRSGLLQAIRAQCRDEASFQRRRQNLEELAEWFDGGKGAGPGELAAQLALLSPADKGEAGNQVRLVSLHAAKGRELRDVVLVGVGDGTLPHEASIEEGRIDEERRLLYVGITRAKERLWLSYSMRAQKWGEVLRLKPSRFLDELPAAEIQRDGADPAADAERKKERASA